MEYSWDISQIFFLWVNERGTWPIRMYSKRLDREEIKIAYEALNATPQNVRKWTALLAKFLIT